MSGGMTDINEKRVGMFWHDVLETQEIENELGQRAFAVTLGMTNEAAQLLVGYAIRPEDQSPTHLCPDDVAVMVRAVVAGAIETASEHAVKELEKAGIVVSDEIAEA